MQISFEGVEGFAGDELGMLLLLVKQRFWPRGSSVFRGFCVPDLGRYGFGFDALDTLIGHLEGPGKNAYWYSYLLKLLTQLCSGRHTDSWIHQCVPRQVVGRFSLISKSRMVGSASPRWTSAGRFHEMASCVKKALSVAGV